MWASLLLFPSTHCGSGVPGGHRLGPPLRSQPPLTSPVATPLPRGPRGALARGGGEGEQPHTAPPQGYWHADLAPQPPILPARSK